MKKAARMVLVIAMVAMAMTAVTCRQIPSYLMRACKVYGKVTDADTLLPVEGAEVFVGTTFGTSEYSELTNGLGQYEVELAEGTWTLSFTREGYGPWSVDVTVDEKNAQRVEQNALLDPFIPDIVGVWFGRASPA